MVTHHDLHWSTFLLPWLEVLKHTLSCSICLRSAVGRAGSFYGNFHGGAVFLAPPPARTYFERFRKFVKKCVWETTLYALYELRSTFHGFAVDQLVHVHRVFLRYFPWIYSMKYLAPLGSLVSPCNNTILLEFVQWNALITFH